MRSWSTVYAVCVMPVAVVELLCGTVSTRTGSRIRSRVSLSTSGAMVAEKSSVWRSAGILAAMRRTTGRKPMSSMRSASSSTSSETSSSRAAPCAMRSSSRPGQATMISVPRAKAAICAPKPTPP